MKDKRTEKYLYIIFFVVFSLVYYAVWTSKQSSASKEANIYVETTTITPVPTFNTLPIYRYKGSSQTDSGSGYNAGYEWAVENDPDDIGFCSGNSSSFNEGCRDYVAEMAEEYPDDYSY